MGGWFEKLPKCIFENFEIAQVKRGEFEKFWKFITKIAQTKHVIIGWLHQMNKHFVLKHKY